MRMALRLTAQTAIFAAKSRGTQLATEEVHATTLLHDVDLDCVQLELGEFE